MGFLINSAFFCFEEKFLSFFDAIILRKSPSGGLGPPKKPSILGAPFKHIDVVRRITKNVML